MKARIVIPVLAAAALAGGLLFANTAGAKPLPDPGVGEIPPIEANSPFESDAAEAWAASVNEAIAALNEGKKNEDGHRLVVDQEDAVTDSEGKVRLCLNTNPLEEDILEPSDVNPAGGLGTCPEGTAAPYDPRVTSVMVDLAGNLDNPGNSPTETQTRFNVADGGVLVFLKNGQPVANSTVRFTYVAVGPA